MSNRNRQVRLSTEMLFAVLVSAAVVYLASQRIGQQIAPGTVGRFLAALMMILLMGCVLKWTGLLRFTGRKAALQSVTVLVTAVSVISGGLAVSAFAVQTGLPLTAEDVSRAVSGAASGAASHRPAGVARNCSAASRHTSRATRPANGTRRACASAFCAST